MNADLADEPVAAPRRRWITTHLKLALAGCAIVALIVGAVLFATDPAERFSLKGKGTAAAPAQSGAATPYKLTGTLEPNDPALHFSETRMGQVLFASANSDKCRRVLFDNKDGTSYWVRAIDCSRPVEQAAVSEKPDRLMAVKNSFKR